MEYEKTRENQLVRLDSKFIISIVRRQRKSHGGEKLFAKLTKTRLRKWAGKALHRLGLEKEGAGGIFHPQSTLLGLKRGTIIMASVHVRKSKLGADGCRIKLP